MIDRHRLPVAHASFVERPAPTRRRGGRSIRTGRGAAPADVLGALAAATVLAVLLTPALSGMRGSAMIETSLDNLRVLGIAHGTYAADWNDRQWTAVVDVISAWGDDAALAFNAYNDAKFNDLHPPITSGWGIEDGSIVHYAYRMPFSLANRRLVEPIVFDGPSFGTNGFLGSFRFPNDARFASYVGGRFYDPDFYAPADPVVWPLVEPFFEQPMPYVAVPETPGFGEAPYWSSYCLSPAAMFDPAVMTARRPGPSGPQGGWEDPWSFDSGLRSPAVSQARHPALKTRMLEHHWLQDAPEDPCNPLLFRRFYPDPDDPEARCEPYYFNQGLASAPATLFFDGSTRLLSNVEAAAADEQLRRASGGDGFDGTWSRTTPFGNDGYDADDPAPGPLRLSHHVLTADGILGRDTLDPSSLDGDAARRIARRLRGPAAGAPAEDLSSPADPSAIAPLRRLAGWAESLADAGPHRD